MCIGGGGGDSTSTSQGQASANVTFTPTITIGGNVADPGQDSKETFAKILSAAQPSPLTLPESQEKEPDNQTTKILAVVAVGLIARRMLRG